MGAITLHAIEVWAHHGAGLDERERGQPFIVDVTLEADLERAAATDDLGDTVDYAPLSRRIAEAAAQGPHTLLETVASRVLDVVLEDERVTAAEVTVTKPHAPLPVPTSGVSVTLQRDRA
ncbi:MAG: dihydroneopterin aldolase [Nitriliruptorales bacterium]